MVHYYLKLLFIIFFCSINSIVLPKKFQPTGMPGQLSTMQDLNPNDLAEIEALEEQWAQAAKDIDQYVASLPPEQQAEFHQAVKEIENMIESMSEEEFNKLIGEMFQEEAALNQPESIPSLPAIPEEKIEAPILTLEQERKQENALLLIESLIKHTNSFIVKNQSIIEISTSVIRWAQQGKIDSWPAGMTWSSFEKQIDTFNQRLHLLLDKDTKTKSYRYLLELVNNEKVFTYLSKLERVLSQQEPAIKTPSFNIEKIGSKDKEAIQKVVIAYSIALFDNAIIKEIDTLIEKYNPTAKKLKEEEAKALELAKTNKPAPMGRTVTGGRPEQIDNSFKNAGYFDQGGYRGFIPQDNTASGQGGSQNSSDSGSSSGKKPANSTGNGGKNNKPKAENSKPKKEDDKKDTKKAGLSDASADRLLGQFEETLESIKVLFNEYPLLQTLKKHLTNLQEPVDPLLSSFGITAIDKRINHATNQIKSLERKLSHLSDTVKDTYKKEVSTIFDKYKDLWTGLMHDLSDIKNNTKAVPIAANKKYAYFKEEKTQISQDFGPKSSASLSPEQQNEFNQPLKGIENKIDPITMNNQSFKEKKEQLDDSYINDLIAEEAFSLNQEARLKDSPLDEERPQLLSTQLEQLHPSREDKKEELHNAYQRKIDELDRVAKAEADAQIKKDNTIWLDGNPFEKENSLETENSNEKNNERKSQETVLLTPKINDQVAEITPSQTSLFDLLESIQKLEAAVSSFSKITKKNPVPASIVNKKPSLNAFKR